MSGAPTDLSATASETTQIDLSWTAPADDGGSPITTYGIHVSPDGRTDWRTRAGNPNTTYSQIQLAPGTTRYYRVSAANAHGLSPFSNIASATTDTTGTGTSVPGGGGTDPPGGGGGGGGPRPNGTGRAHESAGGRWRRAGGRSPGIPRRVTAERRSRITKYRINGRNLWTAIGSTDTTHTVTGLVNGTVYVFEVRAVNRIGRSRASLPAEATPIAPVALDFAHFANGASWQSGLVFVNGASHPIRPVLYFYDQEGNLIDPELVVDLTGDLEVQEDGALSIQRAMAPFGRTHDFNPRPRGTGVGIGDGVCQWSHRGSPALCPPRHRSRRGGSRSTRKGCPLPSSPPGGRDQHRGGAPITWAKNR